MRNLIVAGVLLLPSITFGKSVVLSLGSGYGKPGWTIDLPITLSGGAQPGALQWTFNFSKDVTGVTVVAGAATKAAGKTLACAKNTCLLFGVNTTTIGDGEVALATFQIAEKPSASVIEIVVNGVVAAEVDGSSISASGKVGKITLLNPARPHGVPDKGQLRFSLRQIVHGR